MRMNFHVHFEISVFVSLVHSSTNFQQCDQKENLREM